MKIKILIGFGQKHKVTRSKAVHNLFNFYNEILLKYQILPQEIQFFMCML